MPSTRGRPPNVQVVKSSYNQKDGCYKQLYVFVIELGTRLSHKCENSNGILNVWDTRPMRSVVVSSWEAISIS